MDKPNPIELWKQGKSLNDSLFEFTDESLRSKYQQSFDNLGDQSKSGIAETWQRMSSGVLGISTATTELKTNLLDLIRSERIIGLGLTKPITPSSQPEIILPIFLWPEKIADINWNESSFSNNGIEYQQIRLIESSVLKETNRESQQMHIPAHREHRFWFNVNTCSGRT